MIGKLYTHKDGGFYKVVDLEPIQKTIQLVRNLDYLKWIKFSTTLIWYSPKDDETKIYVRTKEHFLSSFTEVEK